MRSAAPRAKSDADDADGHGPETVTIAPNCDGRHPTADTYAVYGYAGDGMLIDSDATVRVYVSDELVDTIHVPNLGTCGENWHWTVGTLAIDEGTWTRVNTMAASPPIAYMREGK